MCTPNRSAFVYQVVRNSAKPLGDQLVDEVSDLIASGRLAEGSRLPSVRELSRRTGVSVYTAVTAFERLQARGLVESRRGCGYFVVRNTKHAMIGIEQGPPASADPVLGFTRSAFGPEDILVPAGSGFLPASWFADAIPPSMVSKALKSEALTAPPPAEGDPELRGLLVERLHLAGIPAAPRNIVVTFGASHAFDLIARSFLAPGDTVLVDDPGYFVLPTQLKAHRVNIVSVPTLADGSALDVLEQMARLHRPRMFFTQTLLHNPTGTSASAANCHGILSLAEKYNFLITEDHSYSDLGPPSTSLAQTDELRRVFYVGSFTKVLCPGLRVGFIAAPESCLRQLIENKILTVLSGCSLGESIIREVLASGRYRKHMERLNLAWQRHERSRLARCARPASTSKIVPSADFSFGLGCRVPWMRPSSPLKRGPRESCWPRARCFPCPAAATTTCGSTSPTGATRRSCSFSASDALSNP